MDTSAKISKKGNSRIRRALHMPSLVVITLVKEPQLLVEHTLMVILLAIPIVLLFILERRGKL